MSDRPVIGREIRHVIQMPDGKFYRSNMDAADEHVSNPLDADDNKGLVYLEDANRLSKEGGRIVEVEVIARLTGRTEEQLYPNGKAASDDPLEDTRNPNVLRERRGW